MIFLLFKYNILTLPQFFCYSVFPKIAMKKTTNNLKYLYQMVYAKRHKLSKPIYKENNTLKR